jgi:hypothetical protein
LIHSIVNCRSCGILASLVSFRFALNCVENVDWQNCYHCFTLGGIGDSEKGLGQFPGNCNAP